MPRVATTLKIRGPGVRWGLVTVYALDGSVNRRFPITSAQVEAVRLGGVPPTVLKAVWESGRVLVEGRPCLRGEAYANTDGTLVVNRGHKFVGTEITQRWGEILHTQWEIAADQTISVDDSVLADTQPDPTLTD